MNNFNENDFNEVMGYCNQNPAIYDKIVQGLKEKKLVPFIGTGLPSAIKKDRKPIFPAWSDLLNRMAGFIQDQTLSDCIKSLSKIGEYTVAAQLIAQAHGETKVEQSLREIFASNKIPDRFTPAQKKEAIFSLPGIFGETLMLTTNFDTMIERVYLEKRLSIPTATINDTKKLDLVLNGHGKSLLFKVHGDVDSSDDMVFTKESYDKKYEESASLYKALYTIIRTKKLFFIGSSLTVDRTINMVQEVSRTTKRDPHLGITSVSLNMKTDERIRELSDIGIEAILYPKGHYNVLNTIFNKLKTDIKKS